MGLMSRLRDVRSRRAVKVTQELGNQLLINPLCSDYENVFAQVQPLINDMKMVRPFGVGRNGGKLPMARTPELALLDTPNDEMGWGEFAGSMFATWLTEDELDVHVHLDKSGKVRGYSILPPQSKQYLGNGNYQWMVQTSDGTEVLTKDEVMQLRFSRSPKNIQKGISPATAVRAWAQTEDVLAQYQRAYIENGAIPASITFIRASTQDKFNLAKQDLERGLSGARNKGKTIYVWRQFDNDTGEDKDQIEVKTIQGNNSTLAIRELADIINDHLNKAYGVSNFILGDDSSAKYDNAELSDYQFIKRRVFPALMAFWDQFQFELDRITGGLGYAISFELELPDLTERQKTRAEIAEKHVNSLITLIKAGSLPQDAVKALNLSSDWEKVARGIFNSVLAGDISVDNTKTQLITSSKEHTNISKESCKAHCGSCDHLNRKATPATRCVDAITDFDEGEIRAKAIYEELIALAQRIIDQNPELDEEGVIERVYEELKQEALDGAKDGAEALASLSSDEIASQIRNAVESGLVLSDGLQGRLKTRTTELVGDFSGETKDNVRKILNDPTPRSAGEVEKALADSMPRNRAACIARNETVYAFKSGRLDQDQGLANKYGLNVKLVWRTSEDPNVCPVCAAMNGKVTSLGSAFTNRIELEDGTVTAWNQDFWNDDGKIPDAHVNCVLGDTIVGADNVKAATKMYYSGEVVKLKTRSGKSLCITPNHILLTDRGWVAAKNIKKTDKVIAYSNRVEDMMSNNAIDGNQSTISDKFVTLSKIPGVTTVEMPVSSEDFKGDAVTDQKIQVILPEGFLRNKANSSRLEFSSYLPFMGGKFTDSSLFEFCSLDQLLCGVLLATNSVMGSRCKDLSILGTHGSHPDIHRFTSATAYNARLEEAKSNSSTADIVTLSKSFLADAGLIEFDDVIGIEINSVHNTPVYDLETSSTLYTANGIISSNCRCYFDEILEAE